MNGANSLNWFDSKYYSIYYKHRSSLEAKAFTEKIINQLNAIKNETALDLCCGNGRYAKALNEKGLKVLGVDNSKEQITSAKKFENKKLKFVLANVEDFSTNTRFDYAFNFFTSFGYKNEDSNLKILKTFYKHLKSSGKLVLDFWNPSHLKYLPILNGKITTKNKLIDGVEFKRKAYIKDGFFKKEITISENGTSIVFNEQVMVLGLEIFKKYFDICNFNIINIFGDYALNNYSITRSKRMIFFVEKKF